MADANVGEIVATTIRKYRKKLADNVSNNNALLTVLKQKGNQEPVDGGYEITEQLDHAENRTYKRYHGGQVLDVRASDVMDMATYSPKQAAISVIINGREKAMNRGRAQITSLLRGRMKNAERTFKNKMSADVYSDGTADGGLQVTGTKAQISTTPTTGTVGSINAAEWEFWRNKTNTQMPLTFPNLKAVWQALYLSLCRGSDKTDLIVSPNNTYAVYWGGLTDLQRFTNRKMAGLGWTNNLMFNQATCVLDGGHGGQAESSRDLFLNTDYLHWRVYSGRDMESIGKRMSVNQDVDLDILAWMGNLTCSNRFLQGVAQFS